MDFYGRNSARNGSQPDVPAEWAPARAVTGLEESMLQLGLGSRESYPERPGVSDCVYYMRTGFCGFGERCRYNHPRDRSAVAAAAIYGGEYPQRVGEPACQFYMKTGTCKFGAACKFDHPKHGGGSLSQVPLNYNGFPIRPGEKECSYYLKTGQCKFGILCKFHHPQPAGISMPASAPTFYRTVQPPSVPTPEQYSGASTSWRVPRSPLLPVQGTYGPVMLSPGMVSLTGWNPYSASVSPVLSPGAQPAVRTGSPYIPQLTSSLPGLAGPYPLLPSPAGPSNSTPKEHLFPERPGQPACQYYMRTGECKFGSACRYHHPRDLVVPRTDCLLSPSGFPLRPGVQPCMFYLQNGHCKFGAACRYDHPMGVGTMRYTPSSSSLTDMPIAPYPVGSSLVMQPPSYSSTELQPGYISLPQKDFHSTRMPSSGNTSLSSSGGLIFSQTGSVALSLPGQSSTPLSSSSSRR